MTDHFSFAFAQPMLAETSGGRSHGYQDVAEDARDRGCCFGYSRSSGFARACRARSLRRLAARHQGPEAAGNDEHAALEAGDPQAGSASHRRGKSRAAVPGPKSLPAAWHAELDADHA